jgi:hypothetical protein
MVLATVGIRHRESPGGKGRRAGVGRTRTKGESLRGAVLNHGCG